jgi:hypothetical protein
VQWRSDAVEIGKFEFATSILKSGSSMTPYSLVGSAMASYRLVTLSGGET